ncbi:recombinase RecA [Candidatus Falkowbacteria bacterium CG10_big_fil_rev_8_21_14_0_10_37_14]|uniref:Protein RecA n=1 Tax=Candidatus Falkowbacteria bacterium CG10_big_fil_rev_8_21_14_0_10_37_14 TaxID=1974561 RepID=A0A2M6WUL9_9BACT|nr:recombinase RecA [Candidatus Falkowbacteria bacterium]PIT96482.1 MAG: recombinase RecA [Candidatus Falkowbacteria bacterium CG10_big_fil_rev_8_21_14_0_10_37_14]
MADKKVSTENKSVKDNPRNVAAMAAMQQIRSMYGEGSIMKFGDAKSMEVDVVPTGCVSLDLALGVGGIPRGRIIEIYGPESSGKTTLAQHIIAETQKMGGIAAFIDAEHALDPEYAKKIGININDLIISQPDSGEQALEILETLVRSNAIDVVVLDSVAALVPKKELEGDMGDMQMGSQARLMSQALRKLTSIVSKSHTIVIFINQIRMKIGVFFGNPETTTGGMALKFYSSLRIEVRRAAQIKQGEKIIGNRVKAKVVKNKVAAPFKTCEFDIMYNEGISLAGDILDTGTAYGVISKKGNSYAYSEEKLGVGRESAKTALRAKPELLKELRSKILAEANKKEGVPPMSSEIDADVAVSAVEEPVAE